MRFAWKKYLIMALAGALIAVVIDLVIPFEHPNHNRLHDYILSIFLTISIWEGNLWIDRRFNSKLNWIKNPGKRLALQLPVSMTFSGLSIYAGMWFYNTYACQLPAELSDTLFITSIVIGILFSTILMGIEIGLQFLNHWRLSLAEVEKYKSESLQAQLQNLKNQLNPHFLFNNLSVLSSLVYKDPDKAVDFINQLSKVYRYLLDTKNNELVSLETEMKFIESYNYLLKIRFDTNIVFVNNVDARALSLMLPPLSLQILIENAVKHNEISSEKPLTVEISTDAHCISVRNNLQARSSNEASSKTGLENIRQRYHHFTEKPVSIVHDGQHFTVKLPLLHKDESRNY